MSTANLFPTITGDIARRYIDTARLTSNAVSMRIRELVEPKMTCLCAWCGKHLGEVACEPHRTNVLTHGICDACAEKHFGVSASHTAVAGQAVRGSSSEEPATASLSIGLSSDDASETATAAAPLRSAERLSSVECQRQSSVKASGQKCPPIDSSASSEPWSSTGPSVPAKDSPVEGALGLRLTQPTNPAAT